MHFCLHRFSTKIHFLYYLLSSISIFRFFVNSHQLKQPLMSNNWKKLILMETPTKILLHLICLLENASKQFRGGHRVRQVRQLMYFSFNRHNDITICVYKMLQTSAHSETVIINIEGSIIPSVKFKVVSQLKTHPWKLVRT